ncbi:Serine/threonine-protein kinase PrkC [Lignipirellula cremea]|uniref:Serine/threonine-protein kinase PrkC n=2 Tax=Lignipirellula cremea TaxID=2528010 RepID=A0A518E382_9BACT|nr:Serine/threonine-protein kinase PrkC [Lignipirellula cremea]
MDYDLPLDYLFARLKKSGLLTPDRISELRQKVQPDKFPDAKAAAALLIRQKVISRLQAELLLSRNPERFFIDDYRLIEIVGSGGMGRVYVATERDSRWKVALKVLSDHHRHDMGIVARFQIEAQIGLKLNHPNILRTRDICSTEDHTGKLHYVVMDFVRGVTLSEWLEMNGPMDSEHACDVVMQTALGLHHMHQQQMVHRDVKPSNLLITDRGQVKILDFGLAHFDDDDEEFSMAMIFGQDCMGTPDYISPEQANDSYKIDHTADIYSLGCAFYQALTGTPPFPFETTAQKLDGHRRLTPRRVRELNPDIPPRVESIVHKMLAKRPEHRIASAMQVARLLEPYAQRRAIKFDFSAILRERVKNDRKRSTYIKRQSTIAAVKDDHEPNSLV